MKLYSYQQDAVNAILEFLARRKGAPLVTAPTGSGKSVMIAELVRHLLHTYPKVKVLVCVHQKELIQQNIEALKRLSPISSPLIGVHSASLSQRDVLARAIFGQIQSMYKRAMDFGERHLMIIDECHMVPHKAEGRYRMFISSLRQIAPSMRIVGFSATPYRMKGGLLTDHEYGDPIFTDVCYEISIRGLIAQDKLCNIVTIEADVQYDTDDVKINGTGDFNIRSLIDSVEKQTDVTEQAIQQIVREGKNRTKWLLFTTSVSQAIKVNESLKRRGISSQYVSGETQKTKRDQILKDYKCGKIKALVNCMLYTTGFDVPSIDLVALLRSTRSPGLYMQMVGRGMRIAPNKQDCLILDFGGNIDTHGPIDNIKIKARRKTSKKSAEGAPLKVCPNCGAEVPIQIIECLECAFIFPRKPVHDKESSKSAILSCNQRFLVEGVEYTPHISTSSGRECLAVKYTCRLGRKRVFTEFVCVGYPGYAGTKAKKWFWQRGAEPPGTMDECLKMDLKSLRTPLVISIDDLNKKYPSVISYEFPKETK